MIARLSLMAAALLIGGCGALIDRATSNFATDLEQAVVNYDEPLVVERPPSGFAAGTQHAVQLLHLHHIRRM